MVSMQRIKLLVLLTALWIALSGTYSLKPIILAGGLFSIALVMVVVGRMDSAVGQTTPRPELAFFMVRMPKYSWFLLGKVISANLRVTRMLFTPSLQPDPRLLRMKVGPQTVLGKLVLANSITLTPGTVTLDLRAGEVLVHALGSVSAGSVVNGDIDRELRRLEGGSGVSARSRPDVDAEDSVGKSE